jgi:hypothetical protein
MTILIATETLLLMVLTVLVIGLLRGHAELLRRLGPEPRTPPAFGSSAAAGSSTAAVDITGVALDGGARGHAFSARDSTPVLLAFLTSGCAACEAFFASFADARTDALVGVPLLIVTHGPQREDTGRLRHLAGDAPTVLSSQAWRDYQVPGSPYFVLVDQGRVRGEGVATSPAELRSFVATQTGQHHASALPPGLDAHSTHTTADSALRRSGITAGHPSLYSEAQAGTVP